MCRNLLVVGSTLPNPELVGRLDVANVTEMRIAMQEEMQLVLPLSTDELPGPDLNRPSGTPCCTANYAEYSLSSEANRMLPPGKPMTHHRVRSRSSCHWTLSCELHVATFCHT
jgi:hypothetical protein